MIISSPIYMKKVKKFCVNPGFELDKNISTGLGSVEDSCSFEGGIGSADKRVECPIELEHTEDEDFKQSSIKHLRLRRWLLNNQKKVSRASSKTSGEKILASDLSRACLIHEYERLRRPFPLIPS
ncbi:hypothetical protein V6N13_027208 [Hibiscus sabdariffa]|uniref:Uncharacterized protein n=1 Tax=Hibiscus sabdariffa TaxID=183260 RepID=A0ABR2B3Z3_9ROSI